MKHHADILATIGQRLGESAKTEVEALYRVALVALTGTPDPLSQSDQKIRVSMGNEPTRWVSAINSDTGLAVKLHSSQNGVQLQVYRMLVHEATQYSTGGCKYWL